MDWDGPVERADAGLHEYRRTRDGRWRDHGKAVWRANYPTSGPAGLTAWRTAGHLAGGPRVDPR